MPYSTPVVVVRVNWFMVELSQILRYLGMTKAANKALDRAVEVK
jgi:hypothetical protein